MLAVIVVAAVLVVAGSLMAHWMADDAEDGGADGIRVLPGADTKAGPDLDPSGDSGDQDAPISPAVMPAAERIAPDSADWQELLPRLQQAARADPTDRNAQRKLALAYYNLGRLTEALGIYEALLKAEEDPVLRNRLGNTLRDMGDTGGAEDAYRQAIAEDPALAPPYLNLAELLWRQGRTDEALAIIDRGIAAVPEEQRAALQAARALLSDSR
mgnify:CR=1 FL=1